MIININSYFNNRSFLETFPCVLNVKIPKNDHGVFFTAYFCIECIAGVNSFRITKIIVLKINLKLGIYFLNFVGVQKRAFGRVKGGLSTTPLKLKLLRLLFTFSPPLNDHTSMVKACVYNFQ